MSTRIHCWKVTCRYAKLAFYAMGETLEKASQRFPENSGLTEWDSPPQLVDTPNIPDTAFPLFRFDQLPPDLQDEMLQEVERKWRKALKDEHIPPECVKWGRYDLIGRARIDQFGNPAFYNQFGQIADCKFVTRLPY